MREKSWKLAVLLIALTLTGNTIAETDSESSDPDDPFVPVPIPFSNPTLGTGLVGELGPVKQEFDWMVSTTQRNRLAVLWRPRRTSTSLPKVLSVAAERLAIPATGSQTRAMNSPSEESPAPWTGYGSLAWLRTVTGKRHDR